MFYTTDSAFFTGLHRLNFVLLHNETLGPPVQFPHRAPSRTYPMFSVPDSDHACSIRRGTRVLFKNSGNKMHKIVGFHLDEPWDWVAELDCGHQQSIRRNPIWKYRYWLSTSQGRLEYVGQELKCSVCRTHESPRDGSGLRLFHPFLASSN